MILQQIIYNTSAGIRTFICILLGLYIYASHTDARASSGVELAGDVLLYLLPTTGAALTLGHKDLDGAIQLSGSVAATVAITYTLKHAINAKRPNGEGKSFPSGHTSISFSSAEFMRKRYGWQYGVPAYALASFVAFSRVDSRNHHARDVIAGAGFGILSSFLITRPYKNWQVQAENSGSYYGLNVSRLW
ncbi:MAG: phosphatase PAP2 family protein [Nitrosomonas sp.]|nr:phosphatase PAP2 family protein [Nitrosomonas sp.]